MLKRNFIKGRMNQDSDSRLLEPGEYRLANNIEIVNSEGSDVGAAKNSLSTKQLTNLNLGANPKTIGKYNDESDDNIYWFIKSDTGCFLLEWDDTNKLASIVLKDTREEDVDRVLNLKEDKLITGITKVISEDTKSDLLIWTDDNIDICCINIERSKTWGENNFEQEDLFLIKKQPKFAPKITPTYSSEESNYLEDRFISFGYRYKYLDGERSAISSYSNYNFNPTKFEMDYESMENIGMVNAFNAIRIRFDTGPKQVTDIEIIAKQSNSNNLYKIASFNKIEEGWSQLISEEKSFTFSNNKIHQILPEKELFRTFDNVPRKAKALTLTENILTIGNYLEGYDIKDDQGGAIKLQYAIDIESNDVNGIELTTEIDATESILTFTIPNEIELNQNTRLIFDLKTSEPDYSGIYDDYVEYILTSDLANASELAIDEDFIYFIETILTSKFLTNYDIDLDGAWTLSGNTPFTVVGSTSTTIQISCIVLNYTVDETPLDSADNPLNTRIENVGFFFQDGTNLFYNKIKTLTTCKTNRDFEVGFLYQDKWLRKSTVLTGDNNTIYIPQELSTFQNKLLVNVLHSAPYWADSFKLVVKANPLQYQIIYATVYYPEGVFRWVKLEGANRDKVKEGDTLIVKSDLNGPIKDIIKTRVLEVVLKEKNFIEANTDDEDNEIIEQAGLYMKIKPNGYDMSYSENSIITVNQVRSAGKNRQEKFINANILEAYFGDDAKRILWKSTTINNSLKKPAVVIKDFNNYNADGTFSGAIPIVAGSNIKVFIKVAEGGNGPTFDKSFIAASTHANIKDWWEAEVVDLGSVDDDFDIEFVEQGGEIRILIQGDNTGSPAINKQSVLTVKIEAILVDGLVIFETEPKQAEEFIFYETEQTFEIINGLHQGNLQNQTNLLPASISLDFFNCYVQGNGVESYRFKDTVNSNYLGIDLKPTSTTVEKYKEIRRFSDVTYSEGFIESTNMNGLNVFNASQANFKELEKQHNSIQYLYTRSRNIVVIQEDGEGYILFGRDLLTMADGMGVLSTTPEILGAYNHYQGGYGCGLNPESIAIENQRLYYVSAKQGAPVRLSNDGISVINYGMVSFFRDLFINNPTSKKIGGIDTYFKKYMITIEDEIGKTLNLFCGNTVNKIITEPFTYNLNLNNLQGNVELSYNVISGNATIQAVFDGVMNVASNVSGNGVLSFNRANLNLSIVTVTITPIGESANVQIINTCPIGTNISITTIVIGDSGDIGTSIINRFKIGSGNYYSSNDYFELEGVNKFLKEIGNEGVGKFPTNGNVITLESFKDSSSTAQFKESQFNALGFLVTSNNYELSDIDVILNSATHIPTTKNQIGLSSEINSGSFVLNKQNINDNLYLIFDYRDKNIAPIAVDCVLSEWSEYSTCSGQSTQTRTRTIITPNSGGGVACGVLSETINCPPVDCVVSEWSEYSSCDGQSTQTRTRTVITPASNGGTACGVLSETIDCPLEPDPVVNCVLSEWSTYSACTNNTQTRTRTVITPASGGGTACGVLSETISCVSDVDCELSEWSAYSNCDGQSTQTRTRTVITAQSGNGAACGVLSETIDCPDPVVNCVLSEWSEWSDCVNNIKERTRTVITPASGGGTACGPLTWSDDCSVIVQCFNIRVTSTTQNRGITFTYIDCDGISREITTGGSQLGYLVCAQDGSISITDGDGTLSYEGSCTN
jgi:hypothetical protein